MKISVGLVPGEQITAPVGIVIDVLRATSTICQALDAGFESVTCVGEVDDARALAGPGIALAGERHNVPIEGFQYGNSPREFVNTEHEAKKLVITTTNGTRALLSTASRCETVLLASLLNLEAVIEEARKAEGVAIMCAGVEGEFAIDDAYVAGRIAAALEGDLNDGAIAARLLAAAFATTELGIGAGISAQNIRDNNLGEDIAWCAQESVLTHVPRVIERSSTSVVVS